jgi:hypothetical protein
LTANAGAVLPNEVPSAGSPLSAYTTDFSNGHQQHVLFIDGNNHVREMYFTGSLTWTSYDLFDEAGIPNEEAGIPNAVVSAGALSGYMTTYTVPHQQHVIFVTAVDGQDHIGELYFDENTHWHGRNLTKVAVPKAGMYRSPSQLSAYQTTWDSSQHVNFIDTNGHVSKLYRVK